jgi:hypothetical protein
VLVPLVPLTDEHTDRKRQGLELALARSHQGGPLPVVCSGQLSTLIPLRPERWGPLRELLVVQLALGLDCPYHLPAVPVTEFAQAIGGLPTVEQDIALEARGEPRVSLRQHLVGERRFFATAEPLRRAPLPVETPDGLLAPGEPPSIGRGPGAACQVDFPLHGPIGGVGSLFALTLGVVMMVFDGFEMPGPLVFVVQ